MPEKPREKKHQEESDGGGAPEWMVTFSDCMTLLLTFFVLLLSFSSFDDKVFYKLRPHFIEQMPKVNWKQLKVDSSLTDPTNFTHKEQPDNGSESPTSPENKKSGSLEEDFDNEFSKSKVFTADSEIFFWGTGQVLSAEGKNILSDIAEFLNMNSENIIISENSVRSRDKKGLQRSWAIMNFLNGKGIPKNRLNITSESTLPDKQRKDKSSRIVELVLLEQEISK